MISVVRESDKNKNKKPSARIWPWTSLILNSSLKQIYNTLNSKLLGIGVFFVSKSHHSNQFMIVVSTCVVLPQFLFIWRIVWTKISHGSLKKCECFLFLKCNFKTCHSSLHGKKQEVIDSYSVSQDEFVVDSRSYFDRAMKKYFHRNKSNASENRSFWVTIIPIVKTSI